jgi:signal transduction histidine kinase
MRRRRFFFSAHPVQAIIETLLLGGILWLILQKILGSYYPFAVQISGWVDPLCVFWLSLRLHAFERFLWWRGLIDVSVVGVVSIGVAAAVLSLDPQHSSAYRSIMVLLPIGNCFAFVLCRVGVRLWLFWDRLRRTQLRWSLTHAHLMVVALGAGLLIVLFDLVIVLASLHNLNNLRDLSLIVPATIGLIGLSMVGIVIIMPPSALFSFLVVRRITRRLQTLTRATGMLRGGNYAVRIPVEGEDEVAQLQTNFNAMAADLERTMRELQGERDTVASLLQSRRELVANVSHELRTPVATLRGYLETTLMHWQDNPPPTLHHDLKVMEDEVLRLQTLVEDLFTLARAEVGRLTLQCRPTDVGEIVRRVVETRAPLVWKASKITMVADVPSNLPCVLADPGRLEQALQNLLHNGVRHTAPGGIVAVVLTTERNDLLLHVKDTGEGIAPNDLPHIWERFYQTESARARMGGGTGLGLALVKEWIEMMGGSVSAESMLGEGSCFTLRLPAIARSPMKGEVQSAYLPEPR